jgi:hypothetical protein
LKIRVQQNPVFIDTFNTLGANAVPMPQTEVYTALETGAIDAYEGAVVNIAAFKFQEIQKYLTLDRHAYTPFVVLVGKKFWDGLSPQEQAILREAAIEARDHQRKVSREMENTAVGELRAPAWRSPSCLPPRSRRCASACSRSPRSTSGRSGPSSSTPGRRGREGRGRNAPSRAWVASGSRCMLVFDASCARVSAIDSRAVGPRVAALRQPC